MQDEAKTIAQAAVSSCKKQENTLDSTIKYHLRIKKLPLAGLDRIKGGLQTTINDIAVQTVVSERAARLSK